jgi:beta-glucosidase
MSTLGSADEVLVPRLARRAGGLAAAALLSVGLVGQGRAADNPAWLDPAKTADERAGLLLAKLSQADKIALIQGEDFGATTGKLADLTAYGLPVLLEADSPAGIINLNRQGPGVVMPAMIATASTWNPDLARARGEVLAREARNQGVGVLLYPAGNLVRDPRGGRTGEYLGEDPLLSGVLMAESVRGVQSQHVLATVKHLGVYGWESQRKTIDIRIDEAAARQSDLLAFEIAVERGEPASVMCAYSWFNGLPSCASRFLLTDVLRRDWGFKGFVMADWDAFQDTVTAANAGLDVQSGILPTTNPKPNAGARFLGGGFNDGRSKPPPGPFGPGGATRYYGRIQTAIDAGAVAQSTLDAMVRNILRGIFQTGIVEHPPRQDPRTASGGRDVARAQVEEGAVLLKNVGDVLPLAPGGRIALVGGVTPPFNAMAVAGPTLRAALEGDQPDRVTAETGADEAALLRAVRAADVAIVSVRLGGYEGADLRSLTLPASTEALIRKTAAANPRTIVIVYGSNPVIMPWLDRVAAVLQVWDGGDDSGAAVARLLRGEVNPSGRLPLTFPADLTQLPRPEIPGFNRGGLGGIHTEVTPTDVIEGADVGYRWFARKGLKPQFPFGYGLSYTRFTYGRPRFSITASGWRASVSLTNAGQRAGKEVVQVYVTPPGGAKRLVGFTKLELKPGATGEVDVALEPKAAAVWSDADRCWKLPAGPYVFSLGRDAVTTISARTLELSGAAPTRRAARLGAKFCSHATASDGGGGDRGSAAGRSSRIQPPSANNSVVGF